MLGLVLAQLVAKTAGEMALRWPRLGFSSHFLQPIYLSLQKTSASPLGLSIYLSKYRAPLKFQLYLREKNAIQASADLASLLLSNQTMDLDAVCARCALSPALSLIKYVKAGRRTANTATNKPSKCKNELLGATWITDFLQKQNFDVDQTALCSSCLSVLEPEFSRWIQPRGGTKEKQLLCAAGFWSCTSQKGLKEAHLGAERELLLKLHGKCAQSDRVRL